jgi:hypothetical protein
LKSSSKSSSKKKKIEGDANRRRQREEIEERSRASGWQLRKPRRRSTLAIGRGQPPRREQRLWAKRRCEKKE